jgi:hypothetical protein
MKTEDLKNKLKSFLKKRHRSPVAPPTIKHKVKKREKVNKNHEKEIMDMSDLCA